MIQVRFAPRGDLLASGSDGDVQFFIWTPTVQDGIIYIWKFDQEKKPTNDSNLMDTDHSLDKECWTHQTSVR